MKYIDFNDHHYGLYLTYKDAYIHAILVENKEKVCTLTVKCYPSQVSINDTAYAYVNLDAIENCREILEKFGVKPTGKKYLKYEEFNFKQHLALKNKDMRRDKIKDGVMDVSEILKISTSVVYYAYHQKETDTYHIVTTDGWNIPIEKDYLIKAVKLYNIPVYKSFRKELYQC